MVNKFTRYLKIWLKMASFSMQTETEYRGSFILEIIVEVGFFLVTLAKISVIYSNTPSIVGWTKYQTLTLMGMYMVFSELLLGLAFIHNLRDLPRKISQGSLDLILTKPIDSQYVVSLWQPYFAMVPSLFAGLIVALYGIFAARIFPNLWQIGIFLIAFVGGLVIAYSFGMIVSTLSIWLINATPLPHLAQHLIFISGKPSGVFAGIWRIIFLVAVPVILMISLPTEILIGKTSPIWVLYIWLIAIVFLTISRKFWRFALRHYSSASS